VKGSLFYLWLKYNSKHTAIATINIKFKMLPTPKYVSTKNREREMEAISPRRELAKISEAVKSKLAKIRMKNKKTAPKALGFIK
jgi:hypothetical protein